MIGSSFSRLFETGQYGRFYFVSGYHARGRTFRIFLLPIGEVAIPNGPHNPPRNITAVEVYGVVSGNPGWTESYGWIHKGKWCEDFAKMVSIREAEIKAEKEENDRWVMEQKTKEQERINGLLSSY